MVYQILFQIICYWSHITIDSNETFHLSCSHLAFQKSCYVQHFRAQVKMKGAWYTVSVYKASKNWHFFWKSQNSFIMQGPSAMLMRMAKPSVTALVPLMTAMLEAVWTNTLVRLLLLLLLLLNKEAWLLETAVLLMLLTFLRLIWFSFFSNSTKHVDMNLSFSRVYVRCSSWWMRINILLRNLHLNYFIWQMVNWSYILLQLRVPAFDAVWRVFVVNSCKAKRHDIYYGHGLLFCKS